MPRYFADSPDSLVPDSLAGFAAAHSDLVAYDPQGGYLRALETAPARRVALVSGGGSGHEPLHVGFLGAGLLDAVCPGRVFASPHNRQIFDASRAVARDDGVLHLVKNYTGDRINFGIAAERLAHAGIACARVLIDDDVATDSEEIAVGRRGTGGALLAEKVLGAAADEGRDLDQLAALWGELTDRVRSLAVASAAQTSPGSGTPAFVLEEGMLEFGVGIHGERASSSRHHQSLSQLVETMTDHLLESLPATRRLICLVNGLGATTSLELYGIRHALEAELRRRGIALERSLVGTYVSALDMRGFSLSFLAADDETVRLWDAPAHTPAWPP